MRLSVIGCGYLGAVHAACMADLGHYVVGVDVDPRRVEALSAGQPPFHEPGYTNLLRRALDSGRLEFSTDISAAKGAEVHFVCVGTPQAADGPGADLTYIHQAFTGLAQVLEPSDEAVVVGKSTVPVGTAVGLALEMEQAGGRLIWNPEFLREGYAVRDTLTPDRIVYGIRGGPDGEGAAAVLDDVYRDQLRRGIPRITTDFATAELVKISANAFLATKISFINAVAEICEVTGANVSELARLIGLDERIGKKFLQAGVGFGGGCLPKDLRAFAARAEELGRGESVRLFHEVDKINQRRRDRVVHLVHEVLGDKITGAKVAILGAAFKPHSDDLRDSPAVEVALRVQALGARVVVTDPVALDKLAALHPNLERAKTLPDAMTDADLIVLVTEWREYVTIDPHDAGAIVRARNVIDGRNVLNPSQWREAGWAYYGLGRC